MMVYYIANKSTGWSRWVVLAVERHVCEWFSSSKSSIYLLGYLPLKIVYYNKARVLGETVSFLYVLNIGFTIFSICSINVVSLDQ